MTALKWTMVVVLVGAVYYWLTAERAFDAASVRGQRVLITGTSSGIGEQLAYAYSRLGARVLITARRQNLLDDVGRRCQELGAEQVVVVAADMSLAADRERVMAAADTHFDGNLDHLILNHVLVKHGRWVASPANVTTLRTAFEVNFMSYVEMASLAAKMLTRAGGRVGVISSVSGKVSMAGFAYYSAAKFALDGFFSSWRQELDMAKSNVSITNCVLGLIDTDSAIDSIRQGHVRMQESEAASARDTAEAIIRGVSARDIEIYYPFLAKYAVLMHKFFPRFIERSASQLTY